MSLSSILQSVRKQETEDRHEIPLRIMSAPEPLSEDEFQSVRTELYESVYHYVCEE